MRNRGIHFYNNFVNHFAISWAWKSLIPDLFRDYYYYYYFYFVALSLRVLANIICTGCQTMKIAKTRMNASLWTVLIQRSRTHCNLIHVFDASTKIWVTSVLAVELYNILNPLSPQVLNTFKSSIHVNVLSTSPFSYLLIFLFL